MIDENSRSLLRLTLIGAGLVLSLNALGTLAAWWFGFDVANLAIPGVLLYFAIGYIANRVLPVIHTLIVLVLIALVEVVVSWLFSPWVQFGPFSFG